MTHNARFAQLSVKETLDGNRGIRSTESRMLPDKTPCPGYATEWSVSFHGDMMRGGALTLSREDLAYLQRLRRVTIKYYAHKFNVLSNPEQFTRAVYRYQLYIGDMKEGDYCFDILRVPVKINSQLCISSNFQISSYFNF